ncbi:MAG: hypothetical protein IKZ58_08575 [Selenomonadaceae bacterium]|nr:hypothetical protein [Selenomonadaceae bacterium]
MSLRAPTPPTPPTIDKGDVQSSTPRIDAHQFFEVPEMPFHREEGIGNREEKIADESPKVEKNPVAEKTPQVTRQETTPEDMARDAVANGSGPLTKREITRADNNAPSNRTNQTPIVTTPTNTPSTSDRYERGQAVLREFQNEDDNAMENSSATVAPANFHNQASTQEHGGFFWIVTLLFVVTATFVVAKKFLFRSKPALRKSDIKSDLFKSSSEKLKSTTEKFSKPVKPSAPVKKSASVEPPKPADKKIPPIKTARLPKKDDDDKGKHFEVRI